MYYVFTYTRSDTGQTTYEKSFRDTTDTGAKLQFDIWRSKEEEKCRITIELQIASSEEEKGAES